MANWQITATTIYCDAVDDDVTLMVFKDGSTRCTGYQRYTSPDRETARMLDDKGRKLGRRLACEGMDCQRLTGYRDKLLAEEKQK